MSAVTFDRDQGGHDAQSRAVPVDPTGQGHFSCDAQSKTALATVPDQTTLGAEPEACPSGPAIIQQDQNRADIHSTGVLLAPVDQGHLALADQGSLALVDPSQAKVHAESNFHAPGMDAQPDEAKRDTDPRTASPRPADALLLIFADALDDLERVRIATENRVRSLRQIKGLEGGPEEARLLDLTESIGALEHKAQLSLERAMRQHPLGAWVKATIGIGEKQCARLLAAIGDPAWNHAEDRPRRGPAELWAYCGLHVLNPGQELCETQVGPAGYPSGQARYATQTSTAAGNGHLGDHLGGDVQSTFVSGVAPKRARGQKANWNATAKMRAFLIAESCIKQQASPYRAVYDEGRAKYADAVHAHACIRCGPKDKPAQPGSPLSAGHQHARALRLVMKAVLRDLFIEARAGGAA